MNDFTFSHVPRDSLALKGTTWEPSWSQAKLLYTLCSIFSMLGSKITLGVPFNKTYTQLWHTLIAIQTSTLHQSVVRVALDSQLMSNHFEWVEMFFLTVIVCHHNNLHHPFQLIETLYCHIDCKTSHAWCAKYSNLCGNRRCPLNLITQFAWLHPTCCYC